MCKMAHLGNCDEKHDRGKKEYCIFHKPNKNDKEAREFWEEFFERFKPKIEEREIYGRKQKVLIFEEPIDARGFVFPDVPSRPIKITTNGITWEFCDREQNSKCIDFRGAVFKEEVRFNNAVFNKISFEFASFEKEAHFRDIIMEFEDNKPVFRKTHFKGMAYFNNATLENVWFQQATFSGRVEFDGATFKGKHISFSDAKFESVATFIETAEGRPTVFKCPVKFSNTKFKEWVDFWFCNFSEVSFDHCHFYDTARFEFAEFGKAFFNFATFEKGASFKNAEFHGNVHFEDVEFKKTVEFQSAKFERDAIFNGSTFEKRLIFVEKDISTEPKPKFRGKLEFSNCDFRQGVRFVTVPASNTENAVKKIERQLKELFDPNSPSYSYSLQEAARIQRLSFEKEGKRDEADQMFVIEMRARRKIRMREAIVSGRTWSKFKARLYNFLEWLLGDLFSNYGTGWARLLYMGLGIPLGIFPLVYVLSQYQYLGINFGFVLTLLIFSFLIGAFTSQSFDIEPRRESRKNLIIHSTGIFGILWTIFSLLTTLNPQGSICIPAANSMCKPIEMFSIPNDIFNILYYSMVTFTTLGYGDMHPTGWLKALSAIEALTGAVFMALIVAVIARKWMR